MIILAPLERSWGFVPVLRTSVRNFDQNSKSHTAQMCPTSVSKGFNTDRFIMQQNQQAINKYLTNKVEGRVSINSKMLIINVQCF